MPGFKFKRWQNSKREESKEMQEVEEATGKKTREPKEGKMEEKGEGRNKR